MKRLLSWTTVIASLAAVGCAGAGPPQGEQAEDATGTDTVAPPGGDAGTPSDATAPGPPTDAASPSRTPPDAGAGFDAAPASDDALDTQSAPDGSDQEVAGPVEPGTGFPAAELLLRIVGPAPHGWGQSLASSVPLHGLLFGHADTMTWENATTGESGAIPVGAFWQTPVGVPLVQGDNVVIVTATSPSGTAVDQTVVTYNPVFLFDDAPRAAPPIAFVGEASTIVVTSRIGLYKNKDAGSVRLWLVDAGGAPLEDLGPLVDSGDTGGQCDEVEGDGVFSACLKLDPAGAGLVHLRASVTVISPLGDYTAWSPLLTVEAVARVTAAECRGAVDALKEARALYEAALPRAGSFAARDEAISALASNSAVAEVGSATGGPGLWVRFDTGLLGALTLSPDGERGGGTGARGAAPRPLPSPAALNVGSRHTTVLAPFAATFGELDESLQVAQSLAGAGCPPFDVGLHVDQEAGLHRLRNLSASGIIVMTTHGDASFAGLSPPARAALGWRHHGSQEILWTGEPVDCDGLLQESPPCTACRDPQAPPKTKGASPGLEAPSCPAGANPCEGAGACFAAGGGRCIDLVQADLRRGRVVLSPDTYGALPEFVDFNSRTRSFPSSLVYLGACRSLYTGGFASAFFANGAKTVVGYSGAVTSEQAHASGVSLFEAMLTGQSTGTAHAQSMALPDSAASSRLFGYPNLSISGAGPINPSFESGDDTGWTTKGDGRVVTGLGDSLPADGKFMGLVSTGLGFTQVNGALSQTFCTPAGAKSLSFYWKYLSEELLEFCGSAFQDSFTTTLHGPEGVIKIVDVSVDDLCPPWLCEGCGSQFGELFAIDQSFDQGGVFSTAWRKGSVAIPPGTGPTPVTLTFFTTDIGDSLYDTAVLVDKLAFE